MPNDLVSALQDLNERPAAFPSPHKGPLIASDKDAGLADCEPSHGSPGTTGNIVPESAEQGSPDNDCRRAVPRPVPGEDPAGNLQPLAPDSSANWPGVPAPGGVVKLQPAAGSQLRTGLVNEEPAAAVAHACIDMTEPAVTEPARVSDAHIPASEVRKGPGTKEGTAGARKGKASDEPAQVSTDAAISLDADTSPTRRSADQAQQTAADGEETAKPQADSTSCDHTECGYATGASSLDEQQQEGAEVESDTIVLETGQGDQGELAMVGQAEAGRSTSVPIATPDAGARATRSQRRRAALERSGGSAAGFKRTTSPPRSGYQTTLRSPSSSRRPSKTYAAGIGSAEDALTAGSQGDSEGLPRKSVLPEAPASQEAAAGGNDDGHSSLPALPILPAGTGVSPTIPQTPDQTKTKLVVGQATAVVLARQASCPPMLQKDTASIELEGGVHDVISDSDRADTGEANSGDLGSTDSDKSIEQDADAVDGLVPPSEPFAADTTPAMPGEVGNDECAAVDSPQNDKLQVQEAQAELQAAAEVEPESEVGEEPEAEDEAAGRARNEEALEHSVAMPAMQGALNSAPEHTLTCTYAKCRQSAKSVSDF